MSFQPGWYKTPALGERAFQYFKTPTLVTGQGHFSGVADQIYEWGPKEFPKGKPGQWTPDMQRLETAKNGDWWDNPQTKNKQNANPGGAAKSSNSRHIGNESNWQVACTMPDYCQVGNSVVPFDTSATISKQILSSPNVKAQGECVYRIGDLHKGVKGDAGKGIPSATSQGNGCVKFIEGQGNVKANGIPVVRHDNRCMINCNPAGVGGAPGKVITEAKPANSQAEAPKPNAELQALIDEANDKRSLLDNTGDFFSGAWDGTKRVAGAMWDNPGDTGIGVLKGIGNLPSDLWNLAVMGSKYTGPLSPAMQSSMLNNAAMQAYQAGNIAQANAMASRASQLMSSGYVGDIFTLTNDAQKGGSFLSMLVPVGAVVKGAGAAAKVVRAGDTAADMTKAAGAAKVTDATADAARTANVTKAGDASADGAKAVETTKAPEPGVHVKAAAGEQAAHDAMVAKGYEPLGKTDGSYKPGKNGIDGVYKNPNPPPDYIITEAKYGSSQLKKGLADGTNQLDNKWTFGDRLNDMVGKEQAALIRQAQESGNVQKWLIRVSADGKVTAKLVDAAGSVVKGNAGKVPGF
jgi:hypothetical protein